MMNFVFSGKLKIKIGCDYGFMISNGVIKSLNLMPMLFFNIFPYEPTASFSIIREDS
jgi:hypothetical protein